MNPPADDSGRRQSGDDLDREVHVERREVFRRQRDSELYDIARTADDRSRKAEHKIDTHEAVCAERFVHISKRLDWIVSVIMWLIASVFGALAIMGWDLLKHSLEKAT